LICELEANSHSTLCDSVHMSALEEAKDVEESLFRWISRERFVAFPKVTGVGLNEMASLGKLLAVFVIDDKDNNNAEKSR